eukprot:Colp12_sorted_trinity150504_noHs@33861
MAAAAQRPNVVFVLGGPGAGKGTQCDRIVKEFGYVHLSAGDLLRDERKAPGSQYGELIESYIKDGKIVPVEITINLLKKAMETSSKNDFLIDGFPRNQDNLEGWERIMGENVNLQAVLYINCPEQTCLDRALERGKTSGRSDDNPESWKKRYWTFVNESMPIIQYYEKKGLVREISSIPSADEVFAEVRKVFESFKI